MKTFIIIMGSGRCGTTSVVSYLNQKPNFNIYGENNGIIYNILNSIYRIKYLKNHQSRCSKHTTLSYKNNVYINAEWYNPSNKVQNLKSNLLNIVLEYFDTEYDHIGFKEVRWIDRDLNSLNILEQQYSVKYIFLTRNIDDQIKSIKKTGWNLSLSIADHINQTNENIQNFLNTKTENQFIKKNISVDKNFLEEIYEFVAGDTGKNQVHPLTTPIHEVE